MMAGKVVAQPFRKPRSSVQYGVQLKKIFRVILITIIFLLISVNPLLGQNQSENSGIKSESNGKGFFLLCHVQIAFSEWAPAITYIASGTIKDGGRLAGVYLLSAAAGFTVPVILVRNRPVTLGQMCLSYYGAHRGYLVGYALTDFLHNWGQRTYAPPTFPFFEFDRKGYMACALAGGWIGDYLGFTFAGKHQLSHGTTDMMGISGDWGMYYGLGISALFIPWSSGGDVWKRKVVQTLGLGGLGIGLYEWNSLGPKDYTVGDAISFRVQNGLDLLTLGTLYSYLFKYVAVPHNEWGGKTYLLFGLAFTAGGHFINYKFHQTKDLTFNQGLISIGGAAAGTLFGLAIDLIFKISEVPVAFTIPTIGGWAGYLGSFSLIGGEEKLNKSELRLKLFPENAAFALVAAKLNKSIRLPLLSYSF